MKHFVLTILCCLLLQETLLYAQNNNPAGYIIKVKTGDGWTKGQLSAVLDSAIETTDKKSGYKKTFAISDIDLITVRIPLLKNIAFSSGGGTVLGGILVTSYYLKNDFITPGDPPFGRALWQTMAFGASAGFLYGAFSSLFLHKKISLHRSQYIFENKKVKLNKYLAY